LKGKIIVSYFTYQLISFFYSQDEISEILAESDFHVVETGLRISAVTYMFFQNGQLRSQVEVWPMHEFDIYTDK